MSNNRADKAPRKDIKQYLPEDITVIGIDTDDGPEHPLYDEESNNTPVSESTIEYTMEYGILQPIGCKRDGDRLIAVFGRGRTRLLREVNKRLKKKNRDPFYLPVMIVQGDEKRLISLKAGENSHRREVSPMARARLALELSQKMPEDDAANRMNLSVAQFRNILKLNDLSSAVAKELINGNVSETALATTGFADLSEAEQLKLLPEIVGPEISLSGNEKAANKATKKKKSTVSAVRAKVQAAKGKEVTQTPMQRMNKAIEHIDKLDDNATKDDLWATIKKVRSALQVKAAKKK